MLRGKETKRRLVQNMDGSQQFNNIRVGCRGVLFSKLLLWEGLVMDTLVLGQYFFSYSSLAHPLYAAPCISGSQ